MNSLFHTNQPSSPPSPLRVLPTPEARPKVLEYLSASRLKCWQTCRRQFYFRYVKRIKTPTAPALFIGQQVHEILKLHNWSRWKDEPFDPEWLKSELDDSWEDGLAADHISWKAAGDEAKAKEQAWAMLEAYFEESPVPPSENPEGVEVEVECHLDSFDIRLIGIIDLVRPRGLIVDYKTAARAPSSSAGPQQHATQLSCYALLFRESTGMQESGFELHYLIKTKQPKILVTSLGPMSEQLKSELFRLIDDYLEGISAEAWIPSPGQHCSWCDHQTACLRMSGL